jgi:hypothetical protein
MLAVHSEYSHLNVFKDKDVAFEFRLAFDALGEAMGERAVGIRVEHDL